MTLLLGIDCGRYGAIAFMTQSGELVSIEDMPTEHVQQGSFLRSRVIPDKLLTMLRGTRGGHVVIERPEGFPIVTHSRQTGQRETRQPSSKNMLSFGEMFGIALCACYAAGLTLTEVAPGSWKRAMSLPADKTICRQRAMQRFPAFADRFKRKKDDGRAEAAFMALYAHQKMSRK